MNDTVIVFERVDGVTFTASAGTATGYPLTNLQDGRYATQWKSNGNTAGQTLSAEWSVARSVTSVLIANHNCAALGLTSLVLEGSDDDFGTDVVALATFNTFSSDPLYASGFTNKIRQRLKFNKGSALTVAPQIGMLFLGAPAELPLVLNNPKRGLKAEITRDESLSGLRFRSSPHGLRQTWKIDFGALKAVKNTEIYRWFDGIGVGLHPFWIKDMDDHWHFVGADFDMIEGEAKGNVAFAFKNVVISEERIDSTIELPGNYTV